MTNLENIPSDKQPRRDAVKEKLEKKRFLPPSTPEAKERIRKLQELIKIFKQNHPEIVAFLGFGSQFKGYANEQSDIDGILLFDLTESIDKRSGEWINYFKKIGLKNTIDKDALYKQETERVEKIAIEFKKNAEEVTGKKITIIPLDVSEEKIREALANRDCGDEIRIDLLFLMEIGGNNAKKYRKLVLDVLEKRGMEGEVVWKKIMERLLQFERWGHGNLEKFRNLYPQTIEEGRKKFL